MQCICLAGQLCSLLACPERTHNTQAEAAPTARTLLANWSIPGDAGRRFGAITGDRNPIHLYAFTAQMFGFKRPIAHALYLVARLEAALTKAGARAHGLQTAAVRHRRVHARNHRACSTQQTTLTASLPNRLQPTGYQPAYPAVFETEFKRPTTLPAKLQCVEAKGTRPLQSAVLTGDGSKDVILGRLNIK